MAFYRILPPRPTSSLVILFRSSRVPLAHSPVPVDRSCLPPSRFCTPDYYLPLVVMMSSYGAKDSRCILIEGPERKEPRRRNRHHDASNLPNKSYLQLRRVGMLAPLPPTLVVSIRESLLGTSCSYHTHACAKLLASTFLSTHWMRWQCQMPLLPRRAEPQLLLTLSLGALLLMHIAYHRGEVGVGVRVAS
jgi:hypothetical protein